MCLYFSLSAWAPCCFSSCCRRSRVKITLPFRRQRLLVLDGYGWGMHGRKEGRRGAWATPDPPGGVCLLSFIAVVPALRLLLLLHFPAAPVLCDFFWGHALLFWSLPLPHPVAQAQDTSTSLPWIKLHFKSLILIWRGWQMDFYVNSPTKG